MWWTQKSYHFLSFQLYSIHFLGSQYFFVYLLTYALLVLARTLRTFLVKIICSKQLIIRNRYSNKTSSGIIFTKKLTWPFFRRNLPLNWSFNCFIERILIFISILNHVQDLVCLYSDFLIKIHFWNKNQLSNLAKNMFSTVYPEKLEQNVRPLYTRFCLHFKH